MAVNRRVVLTNRMIKDALISLMDEKDFSKITISDICNRADVNRSTFYSHYTDTKQVLNEIEDDILSRLPVVEDNSSDLRLAIGNILSFVKDNSDLISIMMIKRKDTGFVEKLIGSVFEHYEHLSYADDETRTRLNYIFCVNGIIGIIKERISSDFSISLEAFTDIVLSLAVKVTT